MESIRTENTQPCIISTKGTLELTPSMGSYSDYGLFQVGWVQMFSLICGRDGAESSCILGKYPSLCYIWIQISGFILNFIESHRGRGEGSST